MTDAAAEWLESQYDMRARIPDRPEIFARWARDSELARERIPAHLDLAYGPDPTERLDVFTTPRAKAPILVFIHGGYWRSLDKRDHSFIAPAFTQAGAMVVMPNYALCPAVTIEAIARQMVRALVWVHENASRFGGDPQRIVVAGHSAGGHLAAMLLCCRWQEVAPDLPPQLVNSALAISGLFDLEPLRRTPFLQADLRLTRGSVSRLSPARFERPAGRLHAVVGGNESEEFLRQNQLIRAAWGTDVVRICEAIEGAHHLSIVDRLADPDAPLHHMALELLRIYGTSVT
jgi:arylformamidase